MNKVVKFDYQEAIATITINRPEKRNAINSEVVKGLEEAARKIDNSPEIKVAILTGAGDKAFSAGADIKELDSQDGFERQEKTEASHVIYQIKKPVIAMINGFAVGGGCELALACDLRVASENARLGFPEVTLGWMPGGGGTQLLPRLISRGKALELLLTGDLITARQGEEMGLLNRVVPFAELEEATYDLAGKIANNSLLALQFIKEAVRVGEQLDLNSGFIYEKKLLGICFNSKEKEEGVKRFLEK